MSTLTLQDTACPSADTHHFICTVSLYFIISIKDDHCRHCRSYQVVYMLGNQIRCNPAPLLEQRARGLGDFGQRRTIARARHHGRGSFARGALDAGHGSYQSCDGFLREVILGYGKEINHVTLRSSYGGTPQPQPRGLRQRSWRYEASVAAARGLVALCASSRSPTILFVLGRFVKHFLLLHI